MTVDTALLIEVRELLASDGFAATFQTLGNYRKFLLQHIRNNQEARGALAGPPPQTWGSNMKIYLAGPMTGIKDLNFPAFHAEAARLRALGHTVVNPAELNADASAPWADCMRVDIAELVACDTVALLDGWTASRGARLEHHIALELGMAPRLSAFFVEAAPVADTCTRCGGAHRLSQCKWPAGHPCSCCAA